MTEERYVVFDCDTGNDDAWALMMLVKAEEEFKKFKIIAVTCVFGNTDVTNVTKNTIRVLDSLDRLDSPRNEFFHGSDGFGDVKHSREVDLSRVNTTHAVNAMYELVCKYPKKVSFVLVGPLTNFAMCMNMHADFLDKVKDVWIMGGNIRGKGNVTQSAEFNFFCDPEAANIVLEKARAPIYIVPWETCIDGNFGTTWQWRNDVLGAVSSKPMELMNSIERAIFIPKGFTNWVVCDAVLVAAFLFPKKLIANSREYYATVELNGLFTRGQLVLDHLRRTANNVHVIIDIDRDNYKKIISWTSGLPGVEVDWECLV